MRLLVIEDDRQTADFVTRGLEQAGHLVDQAHDGESGLRLATEREYDVLVVDRMLPTLSGLDLVQRLRGAGHRVPVLMLTALSSVEERVTGLEAGADDYLGKPFAFTELLARVRALLRRTQSMAPDAEASFTVGDLVIDHKKRRVTRGGKRLDLTPQEHKLLTFLAQRQGETVTRSMLLEYLWGYDFDPRTNIVDAHMSRLRAKVDREHPKALIHTVRGVGYMLDDD